MRIFVTGATGFVGSAVVRVLLDAGHQVTGLARNQAAAQALGVAGAQVHHGDLGDPDTLRSGAAQADGVIHTGFIHDFTRFKESCETDRVAIAALGAGLAGSDRPLIVTSGTGLLAGRGLAAEDTGIPAGPHPNPRVATEQAVQALAERGLRVMTMRLPPSVHGDGDHGFVPILINHARQTGISAYPGDGANLWPAVHRLDAARLYRLAIEGGTAGARYHAVAEEGVPFRDIATVIGRRLNLPVAPAAADHFGWFTHFAGMDNPATSATTRHVLGWQPVQAGLLADLDDPRYFTA